jgi:uncharacterized protein YggE
MKYKKSILLGIFALFFIALIAVIVIALPRVSPEDKENFKQRDVITFFGQGEVLVKPDLAIINFAVVSERETVTEAMEENTETMNAIIEFIKEQGIEERDLRTLAFRIHPSYEWIRDRRVFVGYEVNQSLEVRIRDIDKIGVIIEGAIRYGANRVERLQFTVDDKEGLKEEARNKAITAAKEKATSVAEKLEIELVRIVGFSEGFWPPLPPPFPPILEIEERMIAPPWDIPEIMPGEEEITVTVHITYEIR